MNDICKERIRERLIEALKKEGLPTNTAGGMLKISPSYLSMVKNPKLWKYVSRTNWDILQKWVDSGMGISAYASSGGKIVQGKVIVVPASSVEDVSSSESVASEGLKSGIQFTPVTEESYDGSKHNFLLNDEQGHMASKEIIKEMVESDAKDRHSRDLHEIRDAVTKLYKDMPQRPDRVHEKKNISYKETCTDRLRPIEVNIPTNQKIVLDIEINILLNGQRIKIG